MTLAATSSATLESLARMIIEDRCAPRVIELLMREVEPYLEGAARCIATDYPAAVADIVQEARIALWELELGRWALSDAPQLERILRDRMYEAYRTEWRGGLTAAECRQIAWYPLAKEPVNAARQAPD